MLFGIGIALVLVGGLSALLAQALAYGAMHEDPDEGLLSRLFLGPFAYALRNAGEMWRILVMWVGGALVAGLGAVLIKL
jgi:hypothetical protein